MEQGFFENEGITIEGVVSTHGGGHRGPQRADRRDPIRHGGPAAAINAFQTGAPITMVGGLGQSSQDVVWVVSEDAGISSIEELPGHSIAYSSQEVVPGPVEVEVGVLHPERLV